MDQKSSAQVKVSPAPGRTLYTDKGRFKPGQVCAINEDESADLVKKGHVVLAPKDAALDRPVSKIDLREPYVDPAAPPAAPPAPAAPK